MGNWRRKKRVFNGQWTMDNNIQLIADNWLLSAECRNAQEQMQKSKNIEHTRLPLSHCLAGREKTEKNGFTQMRYRAP
jgi:hypothetical protein